LKRLLGISGLTLILSVLLHFSFPGRLIDMKAYDIYSCIRGSVPPPENVVVVGIDEESFSMIKRPWPWPRSLHGKLIRSLRRSGARAIIMHIIFSDPSIPREDKSLAEAIREYGNIVLAADVEVVKTEKFAQRVLVLPLEEFLNAGALFGVSSISVDADNVVRRIFWGTPEAPSSEVSALRMLGIPRTMDERRMIHFPGPAYPIPYVPYYKALRPDTYLPDGFFKGKIVLVGKYSRPARESAATFRNKYRLHLQPPGPLRGVDMFATPFYIMDSRLTPGIEIHANLLASLMRDDFLKPLRAMESVILIILLSFLITFLNRNWSPFKSISLNIVSIAWYLLSSYLLLTHYSLVLPFTAPLIAIVISFVSSGVISYVGVERKRRYLREAFSHYLSPQVARKVLEDPERLRLGGQRVCATVLFSDLAGFTEISERIGPEEVVSILTRNTTEMTKIIFKYNGTLDKFIGDAIMAVWGTPAEDEDQAYHACLTALEMQKMMKRLAEGIHIPEYRLSMRIGVNTGFVMAGNMGSEERFDFTVIGDHVNIASRLENLNKVYGTEIIISESTQAKIGERLAVRELDAVRVRGKKQEIRIYELIDEERCFLIEPFERGLSLYREGQFDAAREKFQEALEINPEDKPSQLFIERCEHLIDFPPQGGWSGISDFGS
jgi:adenylate cyclase